MPSKLLFQLKRLYWFVFRPKTQGVKCVIENNGSILMIKRTFGSVHFVFPGGKIMSGETPEQAVVREVREDLGLNLGEVRSLGSFTQTVRYRKETLHCYAAQVDALDFKLAPHIKATQWFSTRELTNLTPVSKSVFDLYHSKQEGTGK